MAAPVQSVGYYYGQKACQDVSQDAVKEAAVENGSNCGDGASCDDMPVDKQSISGNSSSVNTMAFQDGGASSDHTSNTNSSRYSSREIDGNRPNSSDVNRYYPDGNTCPPDDYNKSVDTHGQMNPAYGVGSGQMYNRANNYGGEQSGPPDNAPTSSQNHIYSNYTQSNVRPGFPPNLKAMNVNPSSRAPLNAQNFANNQRFMSSPHGIGQQSGPTPTLNQLLQSPNPVQRYPNNYNYCPTPGNMKANQDVNSGNQYAQQWSGSRNMTGPPYQQSFRNQGPMVDMSGMKNQGSHWSSQGNYPQQPPQQQMSPGSATPHYNAAGSPYPQRYPSPQPPPHGGITPPPQSNSRGYPHQQPSYQNSRVSSPQRQHSPVPQSSVPSSVPVPLSPSMAASQPGHPNKSSTPTPSMPNDVSQELTGSLDELSSGGADQAHQQQSSAVSPLQQGTPGSSPSHQLAPGPAAISSPTPPPSSAASPAQSLQHQGSSGSSNLLHRPVPSPVQATSTSRSMSPAVGGNQNIPSSPRPSSVHSDTGSTSGSHHNPSLMPVSQQQPSPQHQQQPGYHSQQQPHAGIPNGPSSMGPPSYNSGAGGKLPPQQGMPPNAQQGYPQGHFPNRGNNNVGGYSMPHPSNSYNASASQYGAAGSYGSRMANHVGPGGFSPGYAGQMSSSGPIPPGYQANTQPGAQAAAQAAVIAAANAATPTSGSSSRTPHYLKQHLQQKMSANNNPYIQSQTSPGQPPYGYGPPQAASPVGAQSPNSVPPSTPLPPNNRMMVNSMSNQAHSNPSSIGSPAHSSHSNMVVSAPPTSAMEGYPGSGKESSQPSSAGTTLTQSAGAPISTTAMANNAEMPSNFPPGGHDEASQHSIASTSSSQHDMEHTDNENSNHSRPKSYKEQISHPPTPASTLPSPGAASMSSYHDEFENASSPGWPRTPASPVYNNQNYDAAHPPHVPHPPIPHHPKRPDGLMKLYELSDDPERRIFLDKLLRFNEERGSPMTNGPTLSKQPLDLFRLYMCVKERAGFQEVTKSRLWKEISVSMGTGSSASTAYALRKQYIKHLLPFECKFDRGGIDPLPLISQLESSSRKKKAAAQAAQATAHPPQDGFHGMEGYPPSGAYPPGQFGPGGPIPPGQRINPEYPGPGQNLPPGMLPNHINSDSISVQDPFSDDMQYQRNSYPPSQYGGNGGPPPRGMGPQYPPQAAYAANNMPPEQFNANDPQQQFRRGSGGSIVQQEANMTPGPPPSRSVPPQQYPGFQGTHFENRERFEQPQANVMPPPTNHQPQQYPPPQRFSSPAPPSSGPPPPQESSNFPSGSPAPPRPPFPGHFNSHNSAPNQIENPPSSAPYQGPMPENSFQSYPNQPSYNQNPAASNKAAPPPPPPHSTGFQKREQFPPSSYPAAQGDRTNNSNSTQYPPPYPPNQFRNDHPTSGQGESNGPPPGWREGSQFNQPSSREDWNSSRPPNWSRFGNSSMSNGPVPPYPGNNSSHGPQMPPGGANMPPSNSPFAQHRFNQQKMSPYKQDNRFMQQKMMASHQSGHYANRREMIFPPDSIEALPPLMIRRKTLHQKDIGGVEAWRILMALKSGLLSESTWALDILSVLLYDDSSVLYFSLRHLPGLLEVLLEHFRKVLSQIFGITDDLETMCYDMSATKRRKFVLSDEGKPSDSSSEYEKDIGFDFDYSKCDFGIVQGVDMNDSAKVTDLNDHTMKSYNGKPVKMVDNKDPFICDTNLEWDRLDAGFECGFDHWTVGGGDTTAHIQTHFTFCDSEDRFVCRLKDVEKPRSVKEEVSSEDESASLCGSNSVDGDVPANSRKRTFSQVEKTPDHDLTEKAESPNREDEDNDDGEPEFPKFRNSIPKRTSLDELEDEAYTRDEPSLVIMTDTQEDLIRRCICISNLIRNLSFVPGNDIEFSRHPGLLLLLGRLILLHHNHHQKRPPQRNYDKDEDADFTDSCSSLAAGKEWWWDMLNIVRENTLVILSNIGGHLDLSIYPEHIGLPLLDGLLHWCICPSAYARDALPTMPPHSVLSPQRLSLETLCKVCVLDANVDLLLATPPFSRIERLNTVLAKSLSRAEDPVVREFSITLLSYFAMANAAMCRIIALQSTSIPLLIGFVEQAEQNALQVANTHGINMLRENPEMMGTSLDMMRRAASTLLCLARVPDNRSLFVRHQSRLLTLVVSQILDQHVAGIISDILFECSLTDEKKTSVVAS